MSGQFWPDMETITMSNLFTVPLSKLSNSPNNVRTRTDEKADAELKASIAAHGLINNLLVAKAPRSKVKYQVVGGGRRLAALQALAADGTIEKKAEIACNLVEGDASHQAEVSTAENFHRLNMTPAEECRAFSHFISEDGDAAAVANRFGLTRRFVEGRLRLASLAPPIFDALDRGEITLDVAQAYGSTSDEAAQLRVFEEYGSHASTTFIRTQLREGATRGDSPIARLVGKDAYVAVGGRIEEDLFSDDAHETYVDTDVLRTIAANMMEQRATELQGELGCAWVKPVAMANSYSAVSEMGLTRIYVPYSEPSEEELARMDAIETEMDELSVAFESAADKDQAKIGAKHDALSDEYDAIRLRRVPVSSDLEARCGRILLLQADGSMELDDDRYSTEPIDTDLSEQGELVIATPEEGEAAERCDDGVSGVPGTPSGSDASDDDHPSTQFTTDGSKMSAKLFDELAVQRRDVIAANLLNDPRLALDYAMFALVSDRCYSTTVSTRYPDNPCHAPEKDAPALLAMKEAAENLPTGWDHGFDESKSFADFRALDDTAKADLLAFAVANSLNPQQQTFSLYDVHEDLADAMEIDFADHWRPTAANYFGRIRKDSVLAILRDVGGEAFAARYASLKKSELAETAEKIFSGEAIVDPDVKGRAVRWTPPIMSRGSSDPTALESGEGEDEEVDGAELEKAEDDTDAAAVEAEQAETVDA